MSERGEPQLPAGGAPGVTRVSSRAARRLVEGILARRCPGVLEPEVEVGLDERDVSRGEVRIGISLAVAYPQGPLADDLAAIRATVAHEVARTLGRPADRIDLVVTRLVTTVDARASVGLSAGSDESAERVAA